MLDAISESQKSALQLRGSLFTLSVLQIQSADLKAIETDLKLLIRQAPKFFENAPIVIDVQRATDPTLDVIAITQLVREHGLIPIGFRGGDDTMQSTARSVGLALMTISKSDDQPQLATKQKRSEPVRPKEKPVPSNDGFTNNLIITKPVRSGQQVYARGGDLIIIGPVSNGAELLADGSIHVYGPLRGRALAGVNGDTKARIFCQQMEADLISIAGRYIVNETLIKQNEATPQQVFLTDEGKLSIQPL